jgi:hypothetical protein
MDGDAAGTILRDAKYPNLRLEVVCLTTTGPDHQL